MTHDPKAIEAMARAIADEQFPSGMHPLNRRGYVEKGWRLYRAHALAAKEALDQHMREEEAF